MTLSALAPDPVRPDAIALVTRKVGQSKTSFYQAMRILPAPQRQAMFAVYAFCREVDDIADEPASDEAKRQGLAAWRRDIETIFAGGTPDLPVARALVEPVRRYGLQKSDFLAVIDGMAMDAERAIQAPSRAELDLYCARVAVAVGRLSVRIFGPWRPRSDDVAEALGRALQLTNILRDLDEDAARDRLYLPAELLEAHRIVSTVPASVLAQPALPQVCRALAAEAEAHFAAAKAAIADCPRADMRPAAIMGGVYEAILRRLIARGWQAPRAPVRLSTATKLWIALKSGYLPH